MNRNCYLVITSISKPNNALKLYAKKCAENYVKFIVIGDKKSPSVFELDGCDFWNINRQLNSSFNLANALPEDSYSRKNIGYLAAIKEGAELIIETDDDNMPYDSFWNQREMKLEARCVQNGGWVNVYKYFSDIKIWPRGFSLSDIHKKVRNIEDIPTISVNAPIQQGLANVNPDVDAIYRLVLPLPIDFKNNENIALGTNTICPFNSQNTTWFYEAFPLMYLPSNCSFRMTDIWRSFIAQRISWEYDWNILFHKPTVYQNRNEHNLLKDFHDEIQGYLLNKKICNELLSLKLDNKNHDIYDNLLIIYNHLFKKGFFPKEELELVNLWINDIKNTIY